MNIKSLMIPVSDLHVLTLNNTVKEAIDLIEEEKLLSLPVVDGNTFIGILSKKYVYETFYNSPTDKKSFEQQSIQSFMKTKIPTVEPDMLIEEAANVFFKNKIQLIPVVNIKNEFIGIVTQKALFKQYGAIFGLKLPKLVIQTYDFKGKLAKICDTIAKSGGNIKNIVQMDTEVMGLQEITLRIDAKDINKTIKMLEQQGFQIRTFDE